MANYKGHIAGAILTGAAVIGIAAVVPGDVLEMTGGVFSDWQFVASLFVLAVLFGLWPDIDTNSKGQDIFYSLGFALDVVLIWQGYIEAAAYLGLLAMIPILGKHRGWTHSKWAMFVVPLPILIVPYLYKEEVLATALLFYIAAVTGYFSHLLLDGRITKYFRVRSPRTW